MQNFTEQLHERYEQRRYDIERPVLEPAELYIEASEVNDHIKQLSRINIVASELPDSKSNHNFNSKAPGKYPLTVRLENPIGLLQNFLDEFDGRVLFVAESAGRREAFMEMLISNHVAVSSVDNWNAFLASDLSLIHISEPTRPY